MLPNKMAILKSLYFILLAFHVTAYRVYHGEIHQKPPLQIPVTPDPETIETGKEYLLTASKGWTYLLNKLEQGGPDKPCADITDLENEWSFTPDAALRAPARELIPILQRLNLATDASYMRVDATTPADAEPGTLDWARTFLQFFKPNQGTIIVENLASQEENMNQEGIGTQHWSDITASIWQVARFWIENTYNQNPGPPPYHLRYIIHHHVRNSETESVINGEIMKPPQPPNGAKAIFPAKNPDGTPNTNFRLLLGCPNGRGLPYLLGDFQQTFERQTIKSVTVESRTPPGSNHIWWHLTWEL